MATITPLQTTDTGADSMDIINTNVTNLNNDKLEKSGGTLTGQISFSGTTHAGVKLNSLTTTQRDALTPANGMIIYNSTTGQVEKYESGAWVGATGVANATNAVEGIVELATQSEIDNDTAIGGTGAALATTPDQLALSKYGTRLPSSDEKAGLGNTSSGTALSASNGIVDEADVTEAKTASKIPRRDANSDILVATTPTSGDAAASKTYVDSLTGSYFGSNGDSTFYSYQLPVNAADNWYVEDTSFTVTSASYVTLISSAATWRIYTTIAGYGATSGYIWSDGKDLTAEFRLKVAGVTTDDIFMGFGNSTRMDSAYNSTETCVGFSIDGSNLYGTTANGTTASLSTAIAGITTSNWNLYKIVLNPGVDAKFYVNGVLKATITTTLPSNGNTVLFGVGSPSTATDAYLMPITIRQEL